MRSPPAKVWRTLTEPELLAKWIMANDMRPVGTGSPSGWSRRRGASG
jgi:uncharacterized protein YndB with AHSA1/START domain